MAANENDMEVVGALVATPGITAKYINLVCDTNDASAINFAVRNGNEEMVTALLNAGATLPARQPDLHYAARCGSTAMVKILLEAHAGVNAYVEGLGTPAFVCLMRNVMDTADDVECRVAKLELLLDYGAVLQHRYFERSLLHCAAATNLCEGITMLVKRGLDVDTRDGDGCTPLHDSCTWGHTEAIDVLIALGASVTAVSNRGWTPLHAAVNSLTTSGVYRLLEHGADINALDEEGRSPLAVLLKPELSFRTNGYNTERDRLRLIKIFLDAGVTIDDTAIQCAAYSDIREEFAHLLTARLKGPSSLTVGLLAIAITQHNDVVWVKLRDEGTGDVHDRVYYINTAVVSALEDKRETVMLKMLRPETFGFSKPPGAEITLTYDGSNFTKEGFELVVDFLSTGSVKEKVVWTKVVGDSRKKMCAFDTDLVDKGLQAAQFFCIRRMEAELVALMRRYGFAESAEEKC